MQNVDRLEQLVHTLDGLGSKPALIDLARVLEDARLTEADVSRFIQINPHHYNRATVAFRDQYELLVMTWQSGQASVPHDHGGSICAMLTLRGQAVESSFSVAADGYVDLEYDTVFSAGQITAGDDSAVHTISNTGSELLVTVHIYSPPLRDFRRFTARPNANQITTHLTEPLPPLPVPTVAIVGGGFSGSISAAQILAKARQSKSPMKVILLEQRGSIGEGLAYSSRELCHLLNVPAGRMSAWADQPNDFLRWATARDASITADDFLPRQWYGEYVRETLLKTAADAGESIELSVVFDEVRRIARHPGSGWMLNLARGTSLRADTVLLAIGHRSPRDPVGEKWTGPKTHFIADPWKMFAMNAVPPESRVVILGSGLTAVDAVTSLLSRGHRGQITLVSRRGLLPQPHLPGHPTPVDLNPLVLELTTTQEPLAVLDLLRRLRKIARETVAAGRPWQAVLDGLRPHIATLWSRLPTSERRRFLSHLRAFWEVHRHRMPVPVANQFAQLLADKSIRVIAGRVESVEASEQIRFSVRGKSSGQSESIECDWVVNATGPTPSNSAAANPAVGSLLIQGLLAADELNLGIKTTTDGNAIAAKGEPVPDLFVVGTLRKPDLWESTAVPELRVQAAKAAEQITIALAMTNA